MKAILLCFSLLCALAAYPQISVRQLFVSEHTVKCDAPGKSECIQVRDTEVEPWRVFREDINGFKYKDGYRYWKHAYSGHGTGHLGWRGHLYVGAFT